MSEKYELSEEGIIISEPLGKSFMLYRIRALREFINAASGTIHVGDLGGYVEHLGDLSQAGTCWVDDNAKVYDGGRVTGDACVEGNASVHNEALVCDKAIVWGKAEIYGGSVIFGNARVGGNIIVKDASHISGRVIVPTGTNPIMVLRDTTLMPAGMALPEDEDIPF